MIWKRTRISHKKRQNPEQRATKQADLEMLEVAAAAGEIDLLYGDESWVLSVEWGKLQLLLSRRTEAARANQ